MTFLRRLLRDRRGAALVEYGLLIAGVALISSAGVSIFGHKTNDLVSSVAAILPGAHPDDNGPIFSGKLIETTSGEDGPIVLNTDATDGIASLAGTGRLGNNLLGEANGDDLLELVLDDLPGGGTP